MNHEAGMNHEAQRHTKLTMNKKHLTDLRGRRRCSRTMNYPKEEHLLTFVGGFRGHGGRIVSVIVGAEE